MDNFVYSSSASTQPRLTNMDLPKSHSQAEPIRSDKRMLYTSKFLQNDKELQNFTTPFAFSAPHSKALFTDSFSMTDATTSYTNVDALTSKSRTFVLPRSDPGKTPSLSMPLPQPLDPLAMHEKPYVRRPDKTSDNFVLPTTTKYDRFDFSISDISTGTVSWPKLNSNINQKSILSTPSSDPQRGPKSSPGTHNDSKTDLNTDKVLETYLANNNSQRNPSYGGRYEELIPKQHNDNTPGPEHDECSTKVFSPDNCSRADEKGTMVTEYWGPKVNPLSDDYLDQLDAHLRGRIDSPVKVHTADRMTQTYDQMTKQTDQTAKRTGKGRDVNVKVQGRSSSLNMDKSQKPALIQKTRSRSVSRGRIRKKLLTCPSSSTREKALSGQGSSKTNNAQGQMVEKVHGDSTNNKAQKQTRVMKDSKRNVYGGNRKLPEICTYHNESELPLVKSNNSLDLNQRQILNEFLLSMTKREGHILMKTISRILENRRTKKNVTAEEKPRVILDMPGKKTGEANAGELGELSDDDLCTDFIQTYCRRGVSPTASASSSSSGTAASVNLTHRELSSSSLSLSPSSPDGRRKCGRYCEACRLIDDATPGVKTRSSISPKGRNYKSTSAGVAKNRYTLGSKSKGFRHQPEKEAARVNKAHQPSWGNPAKANGYFWERDKTNQRVNDQRRPFRDQSGGKRRPRGRDCLGESKHKLGDKRSQNKPNAIFDGKQGKCNLKETAGKEQNDKQDSMKTGAVKQQETGPSVVLKTPTPSPTKVKLSCQTTKTRQPSEDTSKASSCTAKASCDVKSQDSESQKSRLKTSVNTSCSTKTDSSNPNSQDSDMQKNNLNASCSTIMASCDLKSLDQDSVMDLDTLSFDMTLHPSETSLSQKMDELDLEADRNSGPQTTANGNLEARRDASEGLNQEPAREKDDVKEQLNASTSPVTGPSSSPIRIVSAERLKQEMMLHINRHTQDLLLKANEKMKKVEQFLDSMCNSPSQPLPVMPSLDWNHNIEPACMHAQKHACGPQSDTNQNTGLQTHGMDTMGRTEPATKSHFDAPASELHASKSKCNRCDISSPVEASASFDHQHSTNLQLNSSSPLSHVTSSWDSSFVSIQSSGPCLEVTQLDETFRYDQDGGGCRLAEHQVTTSVLTATDCSSTHNADNAGAPKTSHFPVSAPNVFVNAYHVTSPVPVRTTLCPHTPSSASSHIPPTPTRPCCCTCTGARPVADPTSTGHGIHATSDSGKAKAASHACPKTGQPQPQANTQVATTVRPATKGVQKSAVWRKSLKFTDTQTHVEKRPSLINFPVGNLTNLKTPIRDKKPLTDSHAYTWPTTLRATRKKQKTLPPFRF